MVPAPPDGVELFSTAHPLNGWTIVSEEMDDPLYGDISKGMAKALARSMIETKELVGVNILNNSFINPDSLEIIEIEVRQ